MEDPIDIIDEDENIIRTVPKEEARKNNLLRRGADVLVFNSEGKLLIHKRAAIKKSFPNFWSIRVGGWVDSGETPDQAAIRETNEEIGTKNIDLKFLFKYRFKLDPDDNNLQYLYKTIYDGEVIPQEEEVSEYEWVNVEELGQIMEEREFTPGCKFAYKNYKQIMFGDKKYLEEHHEQ